MLIFSILWSRNHLCEAMFSGSCGTDCLLNWILLARTCTSNVRALKLVVPSTCLSTSCVEFEFGWKDAWCLCVCTDAHSWWNRISETMSLGWWNRRVSVILNFWVNAGWGIPEAAVLIIWIVWPRAKALHFISPLQAHSTSSQNWSDSIFLPYIFIWRTFSYLLMVSVSAPWTPHTYAPACIWLRE